MANNRLYIEDTETGERLFVAKSFGNGWIWRVDADHINEWLSKHPHDVCASFGNTDDRPSMLCFRTENETGF